MDKTYFEKILKNIKYDISKMSLEDIKLILDNYNKNSVIIDGIEYKYTITPLQAASLNAMYKELTSKDHPTYIIEQRKVLDMILNKIGNIKINNKPSIYQRLKNNLTNEKPGITIITNKENSFISKYNRIKYDISNASLEDIKDVLDNCDQDLVLINGIQYYFKFNLLSLTSLNARYKELSGKDHLKYLEIKEKELKRLNKFSETKIDDKQSIRKQIKNDTIQTGSNNHIIRRVDEIVNNLNDASLEDINSLLNYYNGNPILINGILYYPFNNPLTATKINEKYKLLTGHDHPIYVKQVLKVIDNLIKDKDNLTKIGAYTELDFEKFEQIKNDIYQGIIKDDESTNYKL